MRQRQSGKARTASVVVDMGERPSSYDKSCTMGQKEETVRVMLRAFVASILVLLLVCGCGGKEEDSQSVSGPAPDFALEDLKGNTLRLEELRGKVVLLNFFATWCGPCRMEIPELIKLHKRFNAKGLEVVGISLDMEGAAALKPFVKNHGITYPILLGTRKVIVDYGNINAIPTSVLIDRNGMIAKFFVGMGPAPVLEASTVALLNKKG